MLKKKTVFSKHPPSNQHSQLTLNSSEGCVASRSASYQAVSFSRTESYSSSSSRSNSINRSQKKTRKAGLVNIPEKLSAEVIHHVWTCFSLSKDDNMTQVVIKVFPDLYEIPKLGSQKARWQRFLQIADIQGIDRSIDKDNPYTYLLAVIVYLISRERPELTMEYKKWKHEEFELYKLLGHVDRSNAPLFEDLEANDMKILHGFRNMLVAAIELIPMRLHKTCILRIVCKLVEGDKADFALGSGLKRIVSHKVAIYTYFTKKQELERTAMEKQKLMKPISEDFRPSLPDYSIETSGTNLQRNVSDELMQLLRNSSIPDGTSDFVELIQNKIVEPGCDLSLEVIIKNSIDILGKELKDLKTGSIITDSALGLAKLTTSAKYDADTDVIHTRLVHLGRSLSSYAAGALDEAVKDATKEGLVIRQDISISRRSSNMEADQFDAYDDNISLFEMRDLLPDNVISQLEKSRSVHEDSTLLRSISLSTQISFEQAIGMELNADFDRNICEGSSSSSSLGGAHSGKDMANLGSSSLSSLGGAHSGELGA